MTPRSINDRLLCSQNEMGWNAVLEGCFSVEWEKQQHQFFTINQSLRTGFKWQVSVCRRIWHIPWDMWKHRNNIEHANDLKIEMEKIDKAIDDELNSGSGNCDELETMLAEFRHHEHQNKSLTYKKRWLLGVQALRGRAARRGLNDRVLQGMRARMRQFLQQ